MCADDTYVRCLDPRMPRMCPAHSIDQLLLFVRFVSAVPTIAGLSCIVDDATATKPLCHTLIHFNLWARRMKVSGRLHKSTATVQLMQRMGNGAAGQMGEIQ